MKPSKSPKKSIKNPEYYFCYIGPTCRDKLDKKYQNGEGHIRRSIEEAFKNVTGHYAEVCGSGWGIKQKEKEAMSFATFKDEYKVLVVKDYLIYKLDMPDYIRAYYLLFKEKGLL
jgi:hypothetical protein